MRNSHLAALTLGLVLLGTVSLILGAWTGVTIALWSLLVVSVFWVDRLVERFYPRSWPSVSHIRGERWIRRALVVIAVLLIALNRFRLPLLIAAAFGALAGRFFSRRPSTRPGDD